MTETDSTRRTLRYVRALLTLALVPVVVAPLACAPRQGPGADATAVATRPAGDRPAADAAADPGDAAIASIRDEGLNRSQVRETLDYLCNVIGPRLTGSPNLRRANDWTRDTLTAWGLSDARLEQWGPFGRGWTLERFSMQVVEPSTIVLAGYPKAWSPGFDAPVEAGVVHLDAKNEADLARFKGKLKGRVVLIGPPRDPEALFTPPAARMDDDRLARLAAAGSGPASAVGPSTNPSTNASRPPSTGPATSPTSRSTSRPSSRTRRRPASVPASAPADGELLVDRVGGPTAATAPTTGPASQAGQLAVGRLSSRLFAFAATEGAALVAVPSLKGDGGTFFVAGAALPTDAPPGARAGPATRPRAWSPDAPKTPPQVTLAVEDYNRLVRMARQSVPLKVAVDLRVKFHADDLNCYNTVAEIPGSDLRDEVVMVGAHLDSWHAGTGATDNAAGSAAAMEAVRIIRALDLKPRRTIRVALWTGEEQGLHGSTAYVKQHFGYVPDAAAAADAATRPATRMSDGTEPDGGANNPATRPATGPVGGIVKGPEYERLSAYFNLDNGTGKIRGIYAQGNAAAVPIFKRWVRPFADLGASTVTLSTSGATDHVTFDKVGLPGFGFIQDPIEYGTRTHHSNMDTFDRVQIDDVKQAATIMAAFVWQAANADARFPRKPAADGPRGR